MINIVALVHSNATTLIVTSTLSSLLSVCNFRNSAHVAKALSSKGSIRVMRCKIVDLLLHVLENPVNTNDSERITIRITSTEKLKFRYFISLKVYFQTQKNAKNELFDTQVPMTKLLLALVMSFLHVISTQCYKIQIEWRAVTPLLPLLDIGLFNSIHR
jgi:hypothetical protein